MYAVPSKPLPPVFHPAPNPYVQGIYANGIVESYQSSGENANICPEVAGSVVRVLVAEGQQVTQGTALVLVDDSIQKAVVEQQRSQAEAAQAMLDELRAQPRKENLEVALAQVDMARATLGAGHARQAAEVLSIEPESLSKDALDSAINAEKVGRANLDVVTRDCLWMSRESASATPSRARHSYRSASIGSSRDAFRAG